MRTDMHRLVSLPAGDCECPRTDDEIPMIDIVPSVCIISVIRLIVLSRLEAVDVTCESWFLYTFPIKVTSHTRELCERRNLVRG